MTTKYQIISDKIQYAFDNHSKELLAEALKDLHNQFEVYHAAIEVKGKSACPISERYLQVLTVETSQSKVTINPVEGRCTLKVSDKCSKDVRGHLLQLTRDLMAQELPPVTLRGRIKYYNGGYECCLQSESKKIKHFIRVEEN